MAIKFKDKDGKLLYIDTGSPDPEEYARKQNLPNGWNWEEIDDISPYVELPKGREFEPDIREFLRSLVEVLEEELKLELKGKVKEKTQKNRINASERY
jgi:hypothetical protein